jgi:PAS domain S-box-containing protein
MSHTPLAPRSAWPLIAGFVVLAAIVVGLAYWAWLEQARTLRTTAERSLEAVGELKATGISVWLKERQGDARVLSGNHLLSAAVVDMTSARGGGATTARIRSYLAEVQRAYNYVDVSLMAPDGSLLLRVPAGEAHDIGARALTQVRKAQLTREVVTSDLYLDPGVGPRLDIVAPVLTAVPGAPPVADVILHIDPETFLYPYIQDWPLESVSGETLLVQRRDDRVLYLNDLRYRPNAALRLSTPLSNTDRPAAMAVSGRRGIVTGVDYRGDRVFAALEPVPDTDWFVVSKVDSSEILDPIRRRGWLTAGFTLLVVGLAAAGTVLLWRARESHTTAEVRASEQRYRALVDHLWAGVVVHAPDTSIVLANPRASELLGLSVDQMAGRTAMDPYWRFVDRDGDTMPPSDYPVNRVLDSGSTLANLVMGVCRTEPADPLWLLCNGYAMRAENGEVEQVVITFIDITEIVRAERELRASERKFRETVEALDEGYYSATLDAVILDHNPAFTRILGFDPAVDLRGTTTPDFWADAKDRGAYLEQLQRHGRIRDYLITAKARDGDPLVLLVNAHLAEGRDGSGTHIEGSIVDFTLRKAAEDEVKRLNEELEERVLDRTAQLDAANSELEAFAYSVSHDLRAPLRHISGFSELLAQRNRGALDEKSTHYLDTITQSVGEMGVLIDDLLQFSRTGRVELQLDDVDMDALVSEVAEKLRTETAGRIVDWRLGRLPSVVGDRTLLRQVWANLLGNAVKYTRGRAPAHIVVGARDGEIDGGDGSSTPADVFFVRDDGVGFDMQYAHKLFGVFQRLHSSAEFEGTGIGLANVQRIVARLGGRVWAEGATGEGATFYFALPRRKGTMS